MIKIKYLVTIDLTANKNRYVWFFHFLQVFIDYILPFITLGVHLLGAICCPKPFCEIKYAELKFHNITYFILKLNNFSTYTISRPWKNMLLSFQLGHKRHKQYGRFPTRVSAQACDHSSPLLLQHLRCHWTEVRPMLQQLFHSWLLPTSLQDSAQLEEESKQNVFK